MMNHLLNDLMFVHLHYHYLLILIVMNDVSNDHFSFLKVIWILIDDVYYLNHHEIVFFHVHDLNHLNHFDHVNDYNKKYTINLLLEVFRQVFTDFFVWMNDHDYFHDWNHFDYVVDEMI